MADHKRPEHAHLLLALQNALRDEKTADDLYVALVAAFGDRITKQDAVNKLLGAQLSLVRVAALCVISGLIGGFISRCVGS